MSVRIQQCMIAIFTSGMGGIFKHDEAVGKISMTEGESITLHDIQLL